MVMIIIPRGEGLGLVLSIESEDSHFLCEGPTASCKTQEEGTSISPTGAAFLHNP